MATQRTPDQYESLMRVGKHFCAASSAMQKIIFLSNWNEWTQGHVLLPDTIFDYSYLEAAGGLWGDGLLEPVLERHEKLFGRPPQLATADGRVASAVHEQVALDGGVARVALPTSVWASAACLVQHRQCWFKRAQRWRA
jgi:hypothetical protein